MVYSRKADETLDRSVLEKSLANDSFHKDTTADFFFPVLEDGSLDPRFMCNVYEDENSPIMFLRGTKSLRLDIQFVDNMDSQRNSEAMTQHFEALVNQAKVNGFTEIVFNSNSRGLIAFCKRRFKFKEVDGELRKLL